MASSSVMTVEDTDAGCGCSASVTGKGIAAQIRQSSDANL